VTGEDLEKRPIALDSVSLLAGIAPGLELEATVVADGPVPPSSAPVSVDEVGRLLRCSEATVRRLIRTAVLRPVGVGERQVRRSDVESYRQSLLRRVPGKPGD
jgi:hypothetical protein